MFVQFIVQPIIKVGNRLEPGAALVFSSAMDAEAAGAGMATRVPGVIVYELWGDAENELWEEPEIMATYGEVPKQ